MSEPHLRERQKTDRLLQVVTQSWREEGREEGKEGGGGGREGGREEGRKERGREEEGREGVRAGKGLCLDAPRTTFLLLF